MSNADYKTYRMTISISYGLLKKIDNLARHNYANRSEIVRLALLEYVRKPDNELIATPDSAVVQKMYEYVKDEHPYLRPTDTILIRMVYERKIRGENIEEE